MIELTPPRFRPEDLPLIERVVCGVLSADSTTPLTYKLLRSKCRAKPLADARRMIFYIAAFHRRRDLSDHSQMYEDGELSTTQIATRYRRDHSTVTVLRDEQEGLIRYHQPTRDLYCTCIAILRGLLKTNR